MSRPTAPDIDQNTQGWQGQFNQSKDVVINKPIPIHIHVGDELDLQSTFPAAGHDQCLVWVDHTVMGFTLYFADAGTWAPYSSRERSLATTPTGAGSIGEYTRIVLGGGVAPYTLILPPAANVAGKKIDVKNLTTGVLTLQGNAAELINAANTLALALTGVPGDSVVIYSDGAKWHTLSIA